MREVLIFILDFFSTREWATITIIGGFILYCFVFNKGVRVSVYHVVKCFFVPKIILPILGAYVYLSFFTFFLYRLGLWSTAILRQTIFFLSVRQCCLAFQVCQETSGIGIEKVLG